MLKNNDIAWECTEKKRRQCHARIRTSNGNFVGRFNTHVHAADIERANIRRLSANVRNRAVTTEERPQNIIGNAITAGNLDQGTSARMPSISSLSRNIHRQRDAAFPKPPVPLDDETDFVIPRVYTRTRDGDLFLQFDNQRDERLLIFGTPTTLDFFRKHTKLVHGRYVQILSSPV